MQNTMKADHVIFLDTETTGTGNAEKEGVNDDKVIQLSYIAMDLMSGETEVFREYYSEDIPISFEAMDVHHITQEMIEGKPKITDTGTAYDILNKVYNDESSYLVAHNAKFDINMLAKAGFEPKMHIIDTLRCAKHILEDAVRHKLGVLYFQYGLYKGMDDFFKKINVSKEGLTAHDALYDNAMLALLFKELMGRVDNDIDKLVELTNTPVLIKTFTFGKHKGREVADIAKEDAGYLRWMVNNMENLDEDLEFTIDYHLNGNKKSKTQHHRMKR